MSDPETLHGFCDVCGHDFWWDQAELQKVDYEMSKVCPRCAEVTKSNPVLAAYIRDVTFRIAYKFESLKDEVAELDERLREEEHRR